MSDPKLFEIIYSNDAENDLIKDKTIKYDKKKIKSKISALKYDPVFLPNVKKLRGNLSGVYSLRFNIKNTSVRATFEISFKSKKIAIICISGRDNVYDKTLRRI